MRAPRSGSISSWRPARLPLHGLNPWVPEQLRQRKWLSGAFRTGNIRNGNPGIRSGMPVDPIGVAVLLIGTLLWAIGAVYSKRVSLPESSTLVAGMTLLCGGGALLFVSLLSGEELSFLSVSPRSVFSMLYLIVFGSIIALTAYFWLLK